MSADLRLEEVSRVGTWCLGLLRWAASSPSSLAGGVATVEAGKERVEEEEGKGKGEVEGRKGAEEEEDRGEGSAE